MYSGPMRFSTTLYSLRLVLPGGFGVAGLGVAGLCVMGLVVIGFGLVPQAVAAQVVELRFFADQSPSEIASVLETSERTVRRHFAYAKAWLHRHLEGAEG